MRYVEYQKTKGKYFKNNTTMSFHSKGIRIFAVVGARGIGKTYRFKRYVLKKAIYDNKKFVWLRSTETMLDELTKDNARNFFSDISKSFKYGIKYEVKDNFIYINGKYVGQFMDVSTFYKRKGNDYNDIDIIVWDEFISEKNEAVRGDRGHQFVNTLESILRLSEDKIVILLANALDKGDNVLSLLGTKLEKGYGYYIVKEKGTLTAYVEDSKEFRQARDKSIVGKLIKGSQYEDVIVKNKFNSDNELLFDKKPKNMTVWCCLHTHEGRCRIYLHESGLYCTSDTGQGYNNVRFVNKPKDMGIFPNTRVIPTEFKKRLETLFKRRMIKFEDNHILNIFKNFF